jgi:hypothetical protein
VLAQQLLLNAKEKPEPLPPIPALGRASSPAPVLVQSARLAEEARRLAQETEEQEALRRETERQRLETEREQAAFLRRLQEIAEKSTIAAGTGWTSQSDTFLSDVEVLAYTVSGKWREFASKVKLGWKSSSKAYATRDAQKVETESHKALRDLRSSGSSSSSSPGTSSASGFLHDLLHSYDSGISISREAFSAILAELIGETAVNAITSSIPFLSTLYKAGKAANSGKKAYDLHVARTGAESASASLRPGTPEAASFAYINALTYYRDSNAATAVTAAAGAIASVFDLGAASGTASALAELAISVHKLYRAWEEMGSYAGTTNPYEALRSSGTMGAFVMLNYPAIGLIDPSRMGLADTVETTVSKFFGLLKSTKASEAQKWVEQIRKAASLVLTQSPLEVVVA